MKTEILNYCTTPPEVDESGTVTGHFCFPKTFLGFQGHFPGNPILPAVVQLQIAQVCIACVVPGEYRLTRVANAKFLDKIGADFPVTVACIDKGDYRFACRITESGTERNVSTFTLFLNG